MYIQGYAGKHLKDICPSGVTFFSEIRHRYLNFGRIHNWQISWDRVYPEIRSGTTEISRPRWHGTGLTIGWGPFGAHGQGDLEMHSLKADSSALVGKFDLLEDLMLPTI